METNFTWKPLSSDGRWRKDNSPGGWAVSVQCLKCSKMRILAEMEIDSHGPAFKAYYCPECSPRTAQA